MTAVDLYKTLRVRRDTDVLHVELNLPERGNAVCEAMLDDLLEVFRRQEPSVRVVVLSGAGEDFCLGGDRTEFEEQLRQDPDGTGIRVSGDKARRVCAALSRNPAVTVAKVRGRAVGAGFALALACDLRIGAENAVFRLPEAALGLPVAWGGLLPRLLDEVGTARVRDMVLTGRPVGAEEALRWSVLQRVEPESELDAALEAWVRPVLRRPRGGLRMTKALLEAHGTATRMADASVLDGELMAAALVAARSGGR
ncbi:enoyl-CoA hydratase/isomerase family protein [Streptomyces fragilis]|uniref:Enoyl-CoA hydratase/isomerase family protein n=1 Tax=Streptomyces fragilis TaxID=67301 RepID=A0ABV2YG97_9ACTN|nr:enoyl-CoA hydratase/isomerase family protein [Streptomyces fragilis]